MFQLRQTMAQPPTSYVPSVKMRKTLRSLYKELYGEEAVNDLDQARVDKYVSELRHIVAQYGFSCKCESGLHDRVILYLKHIDAFGSENKAWHLYFIWVFIFDDKIEKFDHDLLVNTSFDDIFSHGLQQEKRMFDDIVDELPQELREPFNTSIRYWYDGVRMHAYEYIKNSTSAVSMYLARIQTCGGYAAMIAGLAFKKCHVDMVKDIEFIRIANAQNEFIMMVNDIAASYHRESEATDAYVTTDDNIPEIVDQLRKIEKTIELLNTKYIGHPITQTKKIFLWWHIVARRYDSDTTVLYMSASTVLSAAAEGGITLKYTIEGRDQVSVKTVEGCHKLSEQEQGVVRARDSQVTGGICYLFTTENCTAPKDNDWQTVPNEKDIKLRSYGCFEV
ncbi:hypothetical protein EC968_006339 [Mortierella alpina]|nr:hypothetical protein EC968_006339 [Mortierella alpina]